MDKCVGCGYCCTETVCTIGTRIYGAMKSCPALEWDQLQHRHVCKLVLLPGDLNLRYRSQIDLDTGCSIASPWKEDIRDRTGKSKVEVFQMDRYFKLFIYAMSREWISGDTKSLLLMRWINDLQRIGTDPNIIHAMVCEIQHIFKENLPSYLENFLP